jgi:prepilin-type N-terminal cleavage/methylation domain-containing protein/prepilin-type processing-associated H-X9-DG protein
MRRHAFTPVELLVVIAIIAVLLAILVPVVGKARNAAAQTIVISNLREMISGYTMYHQANRGALLWGYPPEKVNGVRITVTDPRSGCTFTHPISTRYPWRLAPYLGNLWSIIHYGEALPDIPMPGDDAATATSKAYLLSVSPTIGLNAIFLGGQKDYGGFPGGRPLVGKHIAFRANEIRRPTQMIVFAECKGTLVSAPGFSSGDDRGLHYLTPPRFGGERWSVERERFVIKTIGTDVGLPAGRYNNRTATAMFDGHVETMLPSELQDMRRWCTRADRPDWDF